LKIFLKLIPFQRKKERDFIQDVCNQLPFGEYTIHIPQGHRGSAYDKSGLFFPIGIAWGMSIISILSNYGLSPGGFIGILILAIMVVPPFAITALLQTIPATHRAIVRISMCNPSIWYSDNRFFKPWMIMDGLAWQLSQHNSRIEHAKTLSKHISPDFRNDRPYPG